MKQDKTQTRLGRVAKKPGVFKAWLLLLVGIVSAAALPIFSPQTTHAQGAPNVYVDRELYDDVTAQIYRDAIAACVQQNGTLPGGDSASTLGAGEWFFIGKAVVGPLLDSTDERRDCDYRGESGGEFLVRDAMAAFGFDDNTEAACILGLVVREDGGNCITSTSELVAVRDPSPQEVQAAIDRHRFFDPNQPNNTPGFSWTDPARYIYYARSFEIGCRATPIALWKEATTTQKNLAENTEDHMWMYVVTADGSRERVIYRMGDGHTRSSPIGMKNNEENFNEVEFDCRELVANANDYSVAYEQYVQSFPPDEGDTGAGAGGDEEGGETATKCDVAGIGWFVCPTMLFLGGIVDNAYSVVSGFLEIQPLATDTGSPLFQAWSLMRNFANVAFVIVFLIIIYSQITSVGISNYNIKKMLPRLVIAAILVNVSYWVCAVAVDISNIMGYSIKDLFGATAAQLYPQTSNLDTGNTSGGRWVPIIAIIIAAGAAALAGLSVLIPLIVGAIISVITALIILALRQALIIILIVLSPLAFVAFLLPNTQSLFDKWRKLFTTLLLMFPLIAVIFGGSALAGIIIQQNADAQDSQLLQILALGVTVIPLFITVFITKMLSMLGGLAGRLTGMVNDPTKGLFDRARNAAQDYRGYRKNILQTRRIGRAQRALENGPGPEGSRRRRTAAWLAGAGATTGLNREQRQANAERALSEAKQGYVAGRASGDEAYAKTIAGPTGNEARIQAAAVAAQKNMENEAIKNAEISANIPPGDTKRMADELAKAVKNNDSVKARAMQNLLMNSGSPGIGAYRDVLTKEVDNMTDYKSGVGQDLRQNMLNNWGGKKAEAADLIKHAGNTKGEKLGAITSNAATWDMPDADLVKQKTSSIQAALKANAIPESQAKSITINPELSSALDASIKVDLASRISAEESAQIISDPNTVRNISKESQVQIANNLTPQQAAEIATNPATQLDHLHQDAAQALMQNAGRYTP